MKKDRRKKYPPLTPEQQQLVLDHRWIAGRLAYSAKAHTGGHTGCLTKEDLESVAYFALCVAAARFDPKYGWKFSTFAWNTARGYIQHALRDYSRMVRVPRWITPIRDDVRKYLSRGGTYDQAAKHFGLSPQQVLLCEESWQEIHYSYDHTPDESRPKEFQYEIDEARVMVGEEVLEKLAKISDKDLDILLSYTEGQLIDRKDREKAAALLKDLKN